ncbi:MAG: hypothetical protein Q4C95_05120 [Planctomycetia bacterium]|nr:hypothetical protein [Planctomycetia bacterium]
MNKTAVFKKQMKNLAVFLKKISENGTTSFILFQTSSALKPFDSQNLKRTGIRFSAIPISI